MAAAKKTPPQYDVTSYLGRSQYVNSTIDAKTAKLRQKQFKKVIGPAAGIGMLAASVGGAIVGAPFMPAVLPLAAMSYVAAKGKDSAERRAHRKGERKAERAKTIREQTRGR
jgi:hypothetical protein